MRRAHRHRGYVLLLTLVLLMIAALATVGASRLALERSASVLRGEEALQRRWGNLSIQREVLSQAEQILSAESNSKGQPLVSVRKTLVLGKMQFDLLIGDEQAKPSANLLLKNHDPAEALRQIRQLLARMVPASRVVLHTVKTSAGAQAVGSFGEIIQTISPTEIVAQPVGGAPVADLLTCFSDGRINVRRASPLSLRAVLATVGNGDLTEQLVRLRAENAPLQQQALSLGAMLAKLELDQAQRTALATVLTDQSLCHSIWIASHTPNGGSRFRLAIEQKDGKREAFEW